MLHLAQKFTYLLNCKYIDIKKYYNLKRYYKKYCSVSDVIDFVTNLDRECSYNIDKDEGEVFAGSDDENHSL